MIKSILSALLLSMDFETGYIPCAASSVYLTPAESKDDATKNCFMLSIKPSFELKFIYGNIELTAFSALPKQGISFYPYRMSYTNEFGIFYKTKSFKTSLGWTHNCQHQVIIANYWDSARKWNDFGYDKISLKFSWSNH